MNNISAIVVGSAGKPISIESVHSVIWCRRVVLIDEHLSDEVGERAREEHVSFEAARSAGSLAALCNRCLEPLTNDWVLYLSGNERLPDDAEGQLSRLLQEVDEGVSAVRLPTYLSLRETPVRTEPFYPGFRLCLFRGSSGQFEERKGLLSVSVSQGIVHEPDPEQAIHLHREAYPNVRELMDERIQAFGVTLAHLEADAGEPFSSYLARVYEHIAGGVGGEHESDVAMLSSIVGGWEELLRGVVRWDEQPHQERLSDFFTLPVATVKRDTGPTLEVQQLLDDLARKQEELERLHHEAGRAHHELDRIRSSLPWRVYKKIACFLAGRRAAREEPT